MNAELEEKFCGAAYDKLFAADPNTVPTIKAISGLFADMIVRECAQKLEDDGMVEIAIELKQYFEVS